MNDLLMLTFAELELVLALRPRNSAVLRGNLRLTGDDASSSASLVRAGLASLLARGLCETVGDAEESASAPTLPGLRFGPDISVLLTALAADDCVTTMAAGWCGERGSVVHVAGGGGARMALFPVPFGRFKAEVLDAGEPVSALVQRFLFRHLAEGETSALVATSVQGEWSVSAALAVDASGRWSFSDSIREPDHAVPVSRERALQRITEVFDGRPYATAETAEAIGPQSDPR